MLLFVHVQLYNDTYKLPHFNTYSSPGARSSSLMTPNGNKRALKTSVFEVLSYTFFLPEWDPCKLSPSSSSPNILPRLTGLLPPAVAALLLPPSSSSTGTTVKLMGILALQLSRRVYEGVSSDDNQGATSCWTFTPNREEKKIKYPKGVKSKSQGPSEES